LKADYALTPTEKQPKFNIVFVTNRKRFEASTPAIITAIE
jgi:hypothetical protein